MAWFYYAKCVETWPQDFTMEFMPVKAARWGSTSKLFSDCLKTKSLSEVKTPLSEVMFLKTRSLCKVMFILLPCYTAACTPSCGPVLLYSAVVQWCNSLHYIPRASSEGVFSRIFSTRSVWRLKAAPLCASTATAANSAGSRSAWQLACQEMVSRWG